MRSLDPAEVEAYSGHSSSVARPGRGPTQDGALARQRATLTLKHVPTGIAVTAEALGPFTRAQLKHAKAQLRGEAWAQLEEAVAAGRR
jgi:hypothetical protein